MNNVRQSLWLFLGVASVALSVGYMVGASETPVAGVAVPVVFGLIITAVGFLGPSNIEKRVDSYLASSEEERQKETGTLIRSIKDELSDISAGVGKILFIFAVFYMLGMVVGAKARIDDWFSGSQAKPQAIKELPWTQDNVPSKAEEAITWIGIQERLLSYGYTQPQIQDVYKLYVAQQKQVKDKGEDDFLEFLPRGKTLIDLLPGPADKKEENQLLTRPPIKHR